MENTALYRCEEGRSQLWASSALERRSALGNGRERRKLPLLPLPSFGGGPSVHMPGLGKIHPVFLNPVFKENIFQNPKEGGTQRNLKNTPQGRGNGACPYQEAAGRLTSAARTDKRSG